MKKIATAAGVAAHAGEELARLAKGVEPSRALEALITQFEQHKKDLDAVGHYADTFHRRVAIPKDVLSEKQIKQLGFLPAKIAIPESGQDRFTSFRHPDHNYHIHSHPGYWTMHLDEHPSSTMLALKAKTIPGKIDAYLEGIPHVVTEGVPGLYAYARGFAGEPAHMALGSLPGALAGGLYGAADLDDNGHPDTLRVLRSAGLGAVGGGLMGGIAGKRLIKTPPKAPVVTGSSMVDRLLAEGAVSRGISQKTAAANWGAGADIARGVGTHAMHGAIPGAILGGLGGLLDHDNEDDALRATLRGAAKGGLLGGGIGALAGHGVARINRRSRALENYGKNLKALSVVDSKGVTHTYSPVKELHELPPEYVFKPKKIDDKTYLYHTENAAMRHPGLWNLLNEKLEPYVSALPLYPPRAEKTASSLYAEGFEAAFRKYAGAHRSKGRARVRFSGIEQE